MVKYGQQKSGENWIYWVLTCTRHVTSFLQLQYFIAYILFLENVSPLGLQEVHSCIQFFIRWHFWSDANMILYLSSKQVL